MNEVESGHTVAATGMSVAQHICTIVALLILGWVIPVSGDVSPEDIDKYGAVYDYLHWKCSLKKDEYRLFFSGKVTIHNVRGESHANVVISERCAEKLQRVEIRALDAAGNEILTRDKDDMTRFCGYGPYSVYEDICYYQNNIDVPQFPFSVVIEYEISGKSLFLWPAAVLQQSVPVRTASYIVEGTDKVTFRYRVSGIEEDTVPVASGTALEWRFDDIPAHIDPEYAAYGYGEPARLEFVPERFEFEGSRFEGDSWSDIARWYHGLAKDRYVPPEEEVYARQIRDTLAFLKEAYDEVTSTIRYVAVQIGIGGWQPYEARKTYERKYGDCKDMSTLLVSLLRNRGVEAYPALVLTRSSGSVNVDFPTFGFNHVICCAILGEDTIWMDPTCSVCPFGEMGWQVHDVPALIVTEEGGTMTQVLGGSPDNNLLRIDADMHVAPDHCADAVLTLTASGNQAIYLRGWLSGESEEEIWTFLKSYIPDLSGPYKLQNLRVNHLYDADSSLVIAVEVTRTKPFRKINNVLYVDAYPFRRGSGLEEIDLEDRAVPIQPPYASTTNSTCRVTFDRTLNVDSISVPEAVSAEHSFGYIMASVSVDSLSVITQFEKRYFPDAIGLDQFDEFSGWCDAVRDIGKQYIKLKL